MKNPKKPETIKQTITDSVILSYCRKVGFVCHVIVDLQVAHHTEDMVSCNELRVVNRLEIWNMFITAPSLCVQIM